MKAEAPEHRLDVASVVVEADVDAVYRAFAEAEQVMQWLPPKGMSGRALEYDFREGGRYRIELTYNEPGDAQHGKTTAKTDVSTGTFRSVEPGKRIVQTVEFESGDSAFAGEMLMTWSLERVPTGTRITVAVENVPPGIGKADHEAGLRSSLENLAKHLR